jgi:hypothetical protein
MRKWFVSLAVLGIASAASAQTIPNGGCNQKLSQALGFDDGRAETSWKVRNPTGHTDAFSVDFDDLAGNAGMTIEGIALNTFQSSSSGSFGIRYVSLCPDNLAVSSLGKTPDVVNPITQLGSRGGTVTITGSPGVGAGYCPGFVIYDVPDASPGTTGGEHAVMSMLSGDSSTWLCSDQTAPNSGRSYFTSSQYATPAIALSGDLMMRLIGPITPVGGSAYVTVNASQATNSVSFSETDDVAVTLWSSAAVQPTLYLQGIVIPTFIALPNLVLSTGFENFAPISDAFQGTICGPAGPPCGFAGFSFGITAFYIDNADLKKNGNGKIKQSNTVACTVTPGNAKVCNPCLCFGQADDGFLDGTIWKVQNPAGPADFFNVRLDHADAAGAPCAVPTNFLSVQAASWDFCGTGPSWASVGIYGASTSLGSNTPDLANVLAASTTLSMAPNASDFSYPATTYDFPDIAASTNTTIANATVMHAAMQWPLGDSCIWIGSDTSGTNDDSTSTGGCSTIPGSTSFFTRTGYTTASTLLTNVNWMMRIDWN